MTIGQFNVSRSGGLFVYTLLRALIESSGAENKSYIRGHHFSKLKDQWPDTSFDFFDMDHLSIYPDYLSLDVDILLSQHVLDLDQYLASCSIVQSDSPMSDRHHDVLPKFAQKVYVVRDPRDRLVSWSEFAFRPYFRRYGWNTAKDPVEFIEMNLEQMMYDWIAHVRGFLVQKKRHDIYFLRYEDLLASFDVSVGGLASYLGINLESGALESIRTAVSFEEMKARDPNHLQFGVSGRFADVLTSDQIERCNELAGIEMALFGYEV